MKKKDPKIMALDSIKKDSILSKLKDIKKKPSVEIEISTGGNSLADKISKLKNSDSRRDSIVKSIKTYQSRYNESKSKEDLEALNGMKQKLKDYDSGTSSKQSKSKSREARSQFIPE